MGTYKRFSLVGPGGLTCRCCAPRSMKSTIKRQAKRREARAVARLVQEQLHG